MTWSPIKKAIENRKAVLFVLVFCSLLGLYSYQNIPKQDNPDINIPIAIIQAYYPGATAQEVDTIITQKIVEEIRRLEGYKFSRSFSQNNVASIVLQLVNDADIDRNWRELREQMNGLENQLPATVSKITINTDLAETAGFILSVSSNNYSYEQLAVYSEGIKKELSKIAGISRIELIGEQKHQIKVEVDLNKLNTYPITMENIINLLAVQNTDIPIGSIITDGGKINIGTSIGFNNLEDIRDTIIYVSQDSGGIVRLKDIASIYWGIEDDNIKVKHNSDNSLLLVGYFVDGQNILPIGKEIDKNIAELVKKLPDQLGVEKILFQPHDVKISVNTFTYSLLWGMAFVVLVVFLGIGIRNALVVSTAIPLVIMTTFTFMNILNIKIHQVSIGALIIVLGMLVDNAIVISDAIQGRIDKGEDRLTACVLGPGEVAVPVLTATLTTIAAFAPLLFLDSIAGEFISSIPQIVIISLSASYVIAIFIIPTLAYIFFKQSSQGKDKLYYLRYFFYSMLEIGLRRKKLTFGLVIMVMIISTYLASFLNLEFFPKADKNMVYINLKAEQELGIANTETLVEEIFELLNEQPEVTGYTAIIGDYMPKFYYTLPIGIPSPDFAQICIQLDLKQRNGFKSTSQFVNNLQDVLDAKILGGRATVHLLEQGEPIGAPIQVRVVGDNREHIFQSADQIKFLLNTISGTTNVTDDISYNYYQYFIDVNPAYSSFLGLTNFDIQKALSNTIKGQEATVLKNKGKEYPVVVKGNIKDIEDVMNLPISSSVTGDKVLLRQIASLDLKTMQPTIKKYNGEQSVTVYSDLKPGYSAVSVERALREKLAQLDFGEVEIVFDGEEKRIRDNFGDIVRLAIFAVGIIYLILLVQFNSLLQPLIILCTIPLSLTGSLLGLTILGQPLSFTAFLGMVSLIGIVVNNAIVLIDLINIQRRGGMDIEAACQAAFLQRFRPIILGTVTTIMALVPLALSGSNLFVPMSIALISGLLVATVLTLIIIPVSYSAFEYRTIWRNFNGPDFN